MSRKNTSMLLCILALTPMAIAMPFALDMYIPTLPHLGRVFHASNATMQLTLNLFILVAGLSQLVVGPVADAIGRRKTTSYCVAILAAGCLLSGFAHSFFWLLAGRFVQAFGSCGLMVICLTIARDLYSGNKLAKSFSIINGIISFSPLLAPFIGSHIDIAFGWQAVFFALLIICLLTIACYYPLIPETCPPEKCQPIPKSLFRTYLSLFKNPIFSAYNLISGAGISFLFVFCALSPVILLQELHVSEANYGFYFAFMGVSILVGSLIAANFIERVGIFRMIILGLCISLAGGLFMLAWYLLAGLSTFGFVVPMLLIGTGATLMLGAGSAASLQPYSKQAGTANAAGGAFRLLLCAAVGLIVSKYTHTHIPLIIVTILFSSLCLTGLLYFKKTLDIDFS